MIGFLPKFQRNFELTVFELTVPDLYLDLFKCYNILTDLWGSPPLGDGRGGWMGVWVGVWGCPMQAHMYMHAWMHAHMHMHGCLHGGGHLQLLYMYILVLHMCNMHVCMCINVRACGGTPRYTHTHSHTPTRARMAQITKYAIELEQIKIIQFCLKIWDFCTFLHLFRLDLVYRWGVVPS